MINPFIRNSSIIINDNTINIKNFTKYVKDVYVLTKRKNENLNPNIYEYIIDDDLFNNIKNKLLLYRVNSNIINEKHFDCICEVNKNIIEDINIFGYDLDEQVIILPILNICFTNLETYMINYTNLNSLSNYYNLILINEYFNKLSSIKIKQELISNLKIKLLKIPNNINITKEFSNRKFFFNSNRITNENIIKYNKIFITSKNSNIISNNENNVYQTYEKKFVDPMCSFKNFKYNPTYKNDILIENFNNILSYFLDTPNLLNQLIFKLMISKDYCHIVVNNPKVLELLNQKQENLYSMKYFLGYAWTKFYFDECSKGKYCKTTDNFVFELETARLLPRYRVYGYINENPYLPIFYDKSSILDNYGLVEYSNLNYNGHGLCSLDKFKQNINYFISNSGKDLLKNINFVDNNMAICGSIIAACIQEKHPLTRIFKNEQTTPSAFYNHFYNNSDIDIAIKGDIFDFIEKSDYFFNILKLNLYNELSLTEGDHIKIENTSLISLFIPENKLLSLFGQNKLYVLDPKNKTEILLKLSDTLTQLKNKYLSNLDQEKLLLIKDKFNFDINDIIININNGNELSIEYNFKYKISSSYLNHHFELFLTKIDDFAGLVSQFHLPCVRGYYNGNLYLLPSCISAHLTYINIDYKYFCGVNDPISIISKYYFRGFYTLINNYEKNQIIKYNNLIIMNKDEKINFKFIKHNDVFFHRHKIDYYNNPLDIINIDTQFINNKIISCKIPLIESKYKIPIFKIHIFNELGYFNDAIEVYTTFFYD